MKGVCGVLFAVAFSFLAVTVYGLGDQAHIARTSKPSEMYISWFTQSEISSAEVEFYPTSSPDKSATVKGFSASYNKPSGYVHNALLQNLDQNTEYTYRCSFDSSSNWTSYYNFVTPNITWQGPFQIPLYGDMGITNSQNTINQIAKLVADDRAGKLEERIPFILHVGDISYANDRPSTSYELVWNTWFQMMSKIMPYMPYMVMPGNHEHESGKPYLPYSQYFKDYNYRFMMPLATPLPRVETKSDYYNATHNMWWSMDHQNVHFAAISTETDYPDAPYKEKFADQVKWLEDDLKSAKARGMRWIFVMGHRPLYSSACCDYIQDRLPPLQKAFEEMFHKYEVDIFFCGHVHAYERTWPVYKNKTVQRDYTNYVKKGVLAITAGAAGDIEGLSNGWISPVPEWSVLRYGKRETYGLLHVVSNTELKWELLDSKNNAVVDSITIKKTE